MRHRPAQVVQATTRPTSGLQGMPRGDSPASRQRQAERLLEGRSCLHASPMPCSSSAFSGQPSPTAPGARTPSMACTPSRIVRPGFWWAREVRTKGVAADRVCKCGQQACRGCGGSGHQCPDLLQHATAHPPNQPVPGMRMACLVVQMAKVPSRICRECGDASRHVVSLHDSGPCPVWDGRPLRAAAASER